MIKTKNFSYIHPMKCGGTFVNDVISDTMECEAMEFHLPRSRVEYKHNFVTSVRNPFDWYVSVYYYLMKRVPHLLQSSGSFKETIMSLLDLKQSNLYDGFLNKDWNEDVIMNFKTKDFADYPDDTGFYSWYWDRMVSDKNGNNDDVYVMRVESLRGDLFNMLNKFSDVTLYQKNTLITLKDVNVEKHRKPYREYYDDELIARVCKQDKRLFDRFGYEF